MVLFTNKKQVTNLQEQALLLLQIVFTGLQICIWETRVLEKKCTTGAGVALYDLAATTYGTAVYDSSGASLVRQPVEGSGFTVAVRLDDTSTNPPLELKGYEMEFIPGDRR